MLEARPTTLRRSGAAAKEKVWQARCHKEPEKAEVNAGEVTKRKAERRPEWHVAGKIGAGRQADAPAGLDAARAAAARPRVEILVSMFSPSRRSKPTLAHVQFVKDGQVFAHFYAATGRLFVGQRQDRRRGKARDARGGDGWGDRLLYRNPRNRAVLKIAPFTLIIGHRPTPFPSLACPRHGAAARQRLGLGRLSFTAPPESLLADL